SGFCAAATHGPIRVGHAVRGLGERDTPSRRRELADALGAWAATWQQLPEETVAVPLPMSPAAAIARVPIVPRERRRAGNIVAAPRVSEEVRGFTPLNHIIQQRGAFWPVNRGAKEFFSPRLSRKPPQFCDKNRFLPRRSQPARTWQHGASRRRRAHRR